MWGSIFLLSMALGYLAYRLSLRPKLLEDGFWRVVDHSDGPFRLLLAVWLLLMSTALMRAMLPPLLAEIPKKPGPALLMAAVLLGGYGFILWRDGRKVFEAFFAGPGELRAQSWPLAAGEQTELTYVRRLRMGRPAGEINANFVRYTRETRRNGKDTGWTPTERAEVIPLRDGTASFADGRLEATWNFVVPQSMGNPYDALGESVFNLFTERSQRSWWVLEIVAPLAGVGTLDSHFPVTFEYVPGRSALRADAG